MKAHCPHCGSLLILGQTYGAESPANTQTVCDTCGTILWINSDLKFTRVSKAQWDKIPKDDRIILAAMQRRVLARHHALKKEERIAAGNIRSDHIIHRID